jgi:2'-5' RNA ligase
VSAGRLRLFIAVSVPEKHRTQLARQVEPLREQLPDARWARLESQHITLKFLGWVDEVLRAPVEVAMAAVADRHAPSEIGLEGVGAFPNRRRARVVWAGIADPAGLLTSLADALESALEPLGFEAERRSFTPHLTLARNKQPRTVNLDVASVYSDRWRVSSMVLFRSHLSPHGARYEALTSATLGRGE